MVTTDFLELLRSARLLAIVRGHQPDAVRASVLTLFEAGVRLVEVSLTGRSALAVLGGLVPDVPAGCLLGAGTVRTEGDVRRVLDAGVHFAVSPAVTESVPAAVGAGMPIIAGALTPTEIETALGFGAPVVKIFPASLGGPGYLAALRQPYPDVPMVPVGGVGLDIVPEYLANGAVAVGVGSPLLRDAAAGGDLAALAARVREFLKVAAG
jgi:2-dehydro-3-deoxyphosphogluconate aldolase / (4S)-4-hydroxy-2-oxoglutarate aldolase